MLNDKFRNISTEDLQKRARSTQGVTYSLAIVLGVLFIIDLINFQKTKALIAVPIALLPILIINLKNLKEIKEELAERNR